MSESQLQLSPDGQQHRERILHLARGEARRRRHVRRVSRVMAIIVASLAVILTVKMLPRHALPPQEIARAPQIPVPVEHAVRIEYIQTDPTISSRLAINIARPMWQRLSDHELLEALADAGKPAGLIELDGRTVLVPQNSTRH